MKRRGIKLLLTLMLGVVLGCTSASILVTGEKRPPISPEMVVLYSTPPPEYKVIGQITTSSDEGLSQKDYLDYALKRLRKEAAKVGANGVIITYQGFETDYYDVKKMVVHGDAIWVPSN